MGGRPISSLSILAYPAKGELGRPERQILKGGAEKMREAGCSILGGHSVADDEIKFGYAVTGADSPGRASRPMPARMPGDALVFTKRIGTGVIATALKRGIAAEEHVQAIHSTDAHAESRAPAKPCCSSTCTAAPTSPASA